MKVYQLNYLTNWKNLPWDPIYKRILLLQKKIYIASKSCKYYHIYKAQNILINCNEAKIWSIQKIFESLAKNYSYYNQDYYNLTDIDKLTIFPYLFSSKKFNCLFKVIIEKIKQYLVYLCVQPEWEARFEPTLQSNINGTRSYIFEQKIIQFLDYKLNSQTDLNIIRLDYRITNKYIDPKYILSKIQTSSYINYCINFWLNSNYIEDLRIYKHSIFIPEFHLLGKLIYKIICNGIEWFYIMAKKNN